MIGASFVRSCQAGQHSRLSGAVYVPRSGVDKHQHCLDRSDLAPPSPVRRILSLLLTLPLIFSSRGLHDTLPRTDWYQSRREDCGSQLASTSIRSIPHYLLAQIHPAILGVQGRTYNLHRSLVSFTRLDVLEGSYAMSIQGCDGYHGSGLPDKEFPVRGGFLSFSRPHPQELKEMLRQYRLCIIFSPSRISLVFESKHTPTRSRRCNLASGFSAGRIGTNAKCGTCLASSSLVTQICELPFQIDVFDRGLDHILTYAWLTCPTYQTAYFDGLR